MLRKLAGFLLILIFALSIVHFFGSSVVAEESVEQQLDVPVIIVCIKLSDENFGHGDETYKLYSLEDELRSAIGSLGKSDGNEVGEGFFRIYFYGANADAIIAQMKPVLSRDSIPQGSFVEIYEAAPSTDIRRMDIPF